MAPAPIRNRGSGPDVVNVARLTAKAELVMEELAQVITDMAVLLRKGAVDAGQDT